MQTMDEKDILLKTIEGLNASIASLSATNKDQAEQIRSLQERIKELTAQIAWLNRQLFGRKTEKLPVYNPDMPDLFAEEFAVLRYQAEEASEPQNDRGSARTRSRGYRAGRCGPVLISQDWRRGNQSGQAQTGDALCQGNHPSQICAQGQHPASSRRAERRGDCPHAADARRQVHRRHQPACRDTASEV